MLRSLFAGVSALRNHQVQMDVIGNNIANVNTAGFKASRVTFKEMLSHTLQSPVAPQEGRGGMNAQQVGLGMDLGTIATVHTQGSLQSTGGMMDAAIRGDGYFVLGDGRDRYYTRAGTFNLDRDGNLINEVNGLKALGWPVQNGVVNHRAPIAPLTLPLNQSVPPQATTSIRYEGNLDARTSGAAPPHTDSVYIFDSLGEEHEVLLYFERVGENEWNWRAEDSAGAVVGTGQLQFDSAGRSVSQSGQIALNPPGALDLEVELDFSTITQFGDESTAMAVHQDGYAPGRLQGVSLNAAGQVAGSYSNGLHQVLGQVALATFRNPVGLERVGDTMFRESANSGRAEVGPAGTGSLGQIAPLVLEMSNVDLSLEFTNMIITQRGFQANSRVITTSDELLQELVNLKR